jgi:hypothetical protein
VGEVVVAFDGQVEGLLMVCSLPPDVVEQSHVLDMALVEALGGVFVSARPDWTEEGRGRAGPSSGPGFDRVVASST